MQINNDEESFSDFNDLPSLLTKHDNDSLSSSNYSSSIDSIIPLPLIKRDDDSSASLSTDVSWKDTAFYLARNAHHNQSNLECEQSKEQIKLSTEKEKKVQDILLSGPEKEKWIVSERKSIRSAIILSHFLQPVTS